MPPTRSRRIVRWAVMTLAGVLLLAACYVSAWAVTPRIARMTGHPYVEQLSLSPVFDPISIYVWDDRPGSALLVQFWLIANDQEVDIRSGSGRRYDHSAEHRTDR